MNHKVKLFWFLFFIFPLQIFAQVSITGTVTDAINSQPIPYATVYVNGTTTGTITNISGQYTLERVIPPCEIVISHISYETVVIEFEQQSETIIDVVLKPRDVILGDVEVIDKNMREENLSHFKRRFLGADYWGKGAKIENDSVLVFHRKKVSEVESGSLVSGLFAADTSSTLFTVNTKGPLMINLPLLGYKLHVNLVHYVELQTGNDNEYRFHTLGYFYFQPYKNAFKRKTNRYRNKQLEAWYNSDRHFCHSLYNDRLEENGFTVTQTVLNPETGTNEASDFIFSKYLFRKDKELKIVGLKDKKVYINYSQSDRRPINLIKESEDNFDSIDQFSVTLSGLFFLKDTCTIRADGSRPDNSIMFGPAIGNKRVGAMLPYDFQPGNEK